MSEEQDGKASPKMKPPSRLSWLFFAWFTPLAIRGWRKKVDDEWFALLNRAKIIKPVPEIAAEFSANWLERTSKSPDDDLSLCKLLIHDGKKSFIKSFILEIFAEICSQGIPQLISLLIQLLDAYHGSENGRFAGWNDESKFYAGLAICSSMFVLQSIHAILINQQYWLTYLVALRTRIGLMSMIFDKSLQLSTKSRTKYPLGRAIALISTSVNRIDAVYPYIHFLWFCPLQIACLLFMLYHCFGSAAYWIVGLLLLAMPLQMLIMNRMNAQRKLVATLTDRRLRFLQETIMGIRVVKYFAWEGIFARRLRAYRDEELRNVRTLMLLASWNTVLNVAIPAFSGVIGFVMCSRDGRRLEESMVFSALSYLNMLDLPLSNMPIMAALSVDAFAATQRIQEFMLSEERAKKPNVISTQEPAILITDGSFAWETDLAGERKPFIERDSDPPLKEIHETNASMVEIETCQPVADTLNPLSVAQQRLIVDHLASHKVIEDAHFEFKDTSMALRNINLQIPKGSLVAIVGPVGSGKSSLLSAIYGEMMRCSGSVTLSDEIAYCPQTAWVLNATVRENILVGQPYDAHTYWAVVNESQMVEDISAMPLGDLTDIGEGGISLSGGQKARLNFARMAYAGRNKSIFLMDDPLSAVDNKVGLAIFEECIVNGCLSGQTRVIVTHHLGILPYCDSIIIMKKGHILGFDTYENLLKTNKFFSETILHQDIFLPLHNSNPATSLRIRESRSSINRTPSPISTGNNDVAQKRKWKSVELQARKVSTKIYAIYIFAAGGIVFVALACIFVGINEVVRTGRDYWLSWWIELKDIFGLKLDNTAYRNVYITLAFLQVLFSWICGVTFMQSGYYASRKLHDQALSRILAAPIRFFDNTPVGRIINRFGRDMDMIDTQIADELWYLLFAFGSMFATLLIMILETPSATPICFLPISLAILLQAIYRSVARQLQQIYASRYSPLMTNFSETYQGLSVLHAMGSDFAAYFQQRHHAAILSISECVFATISLRRWTSVTCEFLSAALLSSSAFMCFILRVSSNSAGLILSSLVNFIFSLDWFIKQCADVEFSMVAVERLQQYAEELASEEATPSPGSIGNALLFENWPTKGHLVFRNVDLIYRPGSKPVLSGINIEIFPGERIGVVGRTGAGKSSILSALLRVAEISSGTITIDDVDIRSIPIKELRSRISIVPQEAILFAGTLRFNLDPESKLSDSTLWDALEKVDMKKMVTTLPGKLEFEVHDMGENFSLGQRQLLCLARAILRGSRLVLMDEATANIDCETDASIQRVIANVFQGSTVLTIAHRLGTIRDYDRIIVMDAGKVAEMGPPALLMSNPNSRLSEIFRS